MAGVRRSLKNGIIIDYVLPDYYARLPKACMAGWGRRFINVDPSGRTLPCHAATTIPGMTFATVQEARLEHPTPTYAWKPSKRCGGRREGQWTVRDIDF